MNSYIFLFYIAAFGPFIKGFFNPAVVILQKDLQFKKEFFYRFCISLLDFLGAVLLIVWLRSPLALVLAMLLTASSEVVLSFIFVTLRPTFLFEKTKAKKIIS
jgi:hypothetical protein